MLGLVKDIVDNTKILTHGNIVMCIDCLKVWKTIASKHPKPT